MPLSQDSLLVFAKLSIRLDPSCQTLVKKLCYEGFTVSEASSFARVLSSPPLTDLLKIASPEKEDAWLSLDRAFFTKALSVCSGLSETEQKSWAKYFGVPVEKLQNFLSDCSQEQSTERRREIRIRILQNQPLGYSGTLTLQKIRDATPVTARNVGFFCDLLDYLRGLPLSDSQKCTVLENVKAVLGLAIPLDWDAIPMLLTGRSSLRLVADNSWAYISVLCRIATANSIDPDEEKEEDWLEENDVKLDENQSLQLAKVMSYGLNPNSKVSGFFPELNAELDEDYDIDTDKDDPEYDALQEYLGKLSSFRKKLRDVEQEINGQFKTVFSKCKDNGNGTFAFEGWAYHASFTDANWKSLDDAKTWIRDETVNLKKDYEAQIMHLNHNPPSLDYPLISVLTLQNLPNYCALMGAAGQKLKVIQESTGILDPVFIQVSKVDDDTKWQDWELGASRGIDAFVPIPEEECITLLQENEVGELWRKFLEPQEEDSDLTRQEMRLLTLSSWYLVMKSLYPAKNWNSLEVVMSSEERQQATISRMPPSLSVCKVQQLAQKASKPIKQRQVPKRTSANQPKPKVAPKRPPAKKQENPKSSTSG